MWFDLVLIIIFAIFLIIGIKKGLLLSLLNLFSMLFSVVLAWFLASPIAKLLTNHTNITAQIANRIAEGLAKSSPAMDEVLAADTSALEVLASAGDGLNGFLKLLLKLFTGNSVIAAGASPANYFGLYISGFIVTILSFLLAFLVVRAVVFLISRLITVLTSNKVSKVIDRTLGGLFGFVRAFLVCSILVLILNVVAIIPKVGDKVNSQMEQSLICKGYSQAVNNFIKKIDIKEAIGKIVNNPFEK